MAFRFTSSAYHWSSKWGVSEKKQAQEAFKVGVKGNVSPQKMYVYMVKKGLGYRKTNLLEDYARAKGVEYAKTVGAAKRAEAWYEQAEKYRRLNPGMDRKQAAEFMERWKIDTYRNVTELEQALSLEAEGGCPSPPC